MNHRGRILLTVAAVLIILPGILWSVPIGRSFPENYDIRVEYRDVIFGAKNDVFAFETVEKTPPGASFPVQVAIEKQNGSFYVVFTNGEDGRYDTFNTGSYILKRASETGEFEQIKIFLRSESGTFVRIYPDGQRSRMDVDLLGQTVYRNIILPVPLEQIALEPFSNIVAMSEYHVDWDLLTPITQRPTDLIAETMVRELKDRIGLLKDSDDGAMDSSGTFRLIEDLTENLQSGLNCSGFAKWVVDGLYQPRTGELLAIEPLKQKHPDRRGNGWSAQYEDLRDPYFGLDWSRNLAVSIRALAAGEKVDIEATDVRYVPFYTYTEDAGYHVDDLQTVLYLLSRQEPGYFYIGSVNQDYGSDPVLKQHVHVLVLFPYFDENDEFQIVVMERNLQTSVKSLRGRYSGDYIHLVRVPTSELYTPPSVAILRVPGIPLLYDLG